MGSGPGQRDVLHEVVFKCLKTNILPSILIIVKRHTGFICMVHVFDQLNSSKFRDGLQQHV